MRRLVLVMSLAMAGTVTAARQDTSETTLASVLQKAGEQVEHYFARAQSIVCLEVVRLQPLAMTWTAEGSARMVESELRLSWDATNDGAAPAEARMQRQVLRINGHKPRENDQHNCTAPEQQSEEPQPLSLLLPSQRADYTFKLAGKGRVDRRPAVMVDYRLLKKVTVESHMVEGSDDCVSFNIEGGMRGRVWIDEETYDVLRLDQNLIGMVDIPLPKAATRHALGPLRWTMERWDTSIRFKRVSFTTPEEALVLPASMASLQVTRGAATPRLRTATDYTNYRRFLTGGRIVGE